MTAVAERATKTRVVSRSFQLLPRGRVAFALMAMAAIAGFGGEDSVGRTATAILLGSLLWDRAAKQVANKNIRVSPQRAGRRMRAGVPAVEDLLVKNCSRSWFPATEVEDLTVRNSRKAAVVPNLAPYAQASCRLALRPKSRGVICQREFRLSTQWPLGMWKLDIKIVVEPTELIVEPTRIPLPAPVAAHISGKVGANPGIGHGKTNSPNGDFHALREALYGDDIRELHALRSAALGLAVARVYQHGNRPTELSVVLDLRIAKPPSGTGVPDFRTMRRLERAVGMIATILDRARREAFTVKLTVQEGSTSRYTVHGSRGVSAAFRKLASARLEPVSTQRLTAEPLLASDLLFRPAEGLEGVVEHHRSRRQAGT